MDDTCLAEFAANYTTRTGDNLQSDDISDALPQPEQEDKGQPRIQLKNDLGYMHKRKRECIIRFHRFNWEKEPQKVYRSKLMLYLPWRDESTDLMARYTNFESHYQDKSDVILANERKYSHNATLINEAVDDLTEHGPPQHAWDQVAPGDQDEGIEVERGIEQEDLDANARLIQQQQQHSTPLLQRFTAESSRELLSPEEYRFHRKLCKNAITALRNNQMVTPYRVFLSGPGAAHFCCFVSSNVEHSLVSTNWNCTGMLTPVVALGNCGHSYSLVVKFYKNQTDFIPSLDDGLHCSSGSIH